MNGIDGITFFGRLWANAYQALIEEKILADHEGKERAARISPKSHYKAISSIETGFFFAAVGRLVVQADGEVPSAFLVNAEFADMQNDSLAGISLSGSERKTVKQRIQTQHLSLMSTLAHFDLFEIQTRKGPLSNDVNVYVITKKGREFLSKLEG